MKFTIKHFNLRYPTSDACLEELKQARFADFTCRCGRTNMLSKITGRPQYACVCGFQVSPLAGTIFHKSSTDLRTWFLTMFLMTTTRSGVSAKTVQRMTGVTYKTAWRMMKQIRTVMDSDGDLLSGVVEADETYLKAAAGKDTRQPRKTKKGNAQTLMGMVERGGNVVVKHVPKPTGENLRGAVTESVAPGTTVYTDGNLTYRSLPALGYPHAYVDHGTHHFMDGQVGTQAIDNFWRLLKGGMSGVYTHCAPKYLQSYVGEYVWRFNNRNIDVPMFELLLRRVTI